MSARSKPLLPTWLPPSHPLYLNSGIRKRISQNFDRGGIFLNIPYSNRYSNLEIAIISTVTAYGLRPRMAKERTGLEIRLLKIVELMLSCRFGLTDLTYVKRMNMPLELGLLLAFGNETFVTTAAQYSALRTISDLNFGDIFAHGGRIGRLISGLSRWIEQSTGLKKRISTQTLVRRYKRLQLLRRRYGQDFDRMTLSEITALLGLVKNELPEILSKA